MDIVPRNVYCSRHTIELIYQHHIGKREIFHTMVPKQEGIHMILFVPNKIFSRSEGKKSLPKSKAKK